MQIDITGFVFLAIIFGCLLHDKLKKRPPERPGERHKRNPQFDYSISWRDLKDA